MDWRELPGTRVSDLARWAARRGTGALAFLDGNDGAPSGRFSFLGLGPVETRVIEADDPDPLALFEALEADTAPGRAAPDEEIVPGLSSAAVPRWIGAISYDLAWPARERLCLRRAPRLARDARPLAVFHRFDALAVGDRESDRVLVVGEDARAIDGLLARLEALASGAPASARVGALTIEPRAIHGQAIEGALALVRDGIVYQINLARRWSATIAGEAPGRALADAMRSASPVPYGALLELGDEGARLALVARTMERFLAWDRSSGRLETRPIKGTIARAPDADDDDARADALRTDAKEHAEHAMIVDLMRNDLGRVAEVGTVEVHRAFEVEPYARLSHLVSTVRAITREGTSLRDVLEATFPPGSVTGTPKLSAIEHIEALERHARGFYCGAIGHVDRRGGLSLAVAIRTAQIADGSLTYFAGGGLVEASVVERELDETELKARALTDALHERE